MNPSTSPVKARIFPAPEGWAAESAGGGCSGGTLEEVCEKLPQNLRPALLLPSRAVVTERFVLPEAPREELLAMAQLQLEKLLPYASEEFVFDLEELGSTEEGVRVLAVTVPTLEMQRCAGPLRSSGRGPFAVGVYAVQVARRLGERGVVVVLWKEEGLPFLMVAVGGKVAWLEGLAPGEENAPDAMEISRSLLGAELAGALPESVQTACVAEADWADLLRAALPGVPLEIGPLVAEEKISGNWVPPSWAAEESELQRKSRFVNRLQWIATVYAAVLAVGFGWLAMEKKRITSMDQQIAQLQPSVELSNARQARWRTLEPAVEPARYLVEVLHQITKAIGVADIRITEFQMGVREFAFSAEASNLSEAIDYVGRLRKEPDLSGFKLESPNPNILPNERAQFRVSGKVDAAQAKR